MNDDIAKKDEFIETDEGTIRGTTRPDLVDKVEGKAPHEWRGTWDRPVKVDEKSLDAFTVARMTDHNVRGGDETDEKDPREQLKTDEAA